VTPKSQDAASVSRRPKPQTAEVQATVTRILEAAREVLIKYGHAKFTTRLVAQAAGISPGNLSYHFPSKRELLRALITRLVSDYSNQMESYLSEPRSPFGQEIAGLVLWLLTDSVAEEQVHLARELWTIALHDAVIRREVDHFYDEVTDRCVQLLRRSHPRANPVAIREFVQVIVLLTAGCNILYGTRASRAVPYERIQEIATGLLAVVAPDLQLAAGTSREGAATRHAKPAR
jgi:AcrR family transcriptional regulator